MNSEDEEEHENEDELAPRSTLLTLLPRPTLPPCPTRIDFILQKCR